MTKNIIYQINDIIGTTGGYGRKRLIDTLELRPDKDVQIVYDLMRAYSEEISYFDKEERIQLTNRLILGLENIGPGKKKEIGTYIEVVCFGEPLKQEHITHVSPRIMRTREQEFNGRKDISDIED